MNKLFLVVPIFCCVLLACSSRPTDIPRDAKQHWDFINGYSWTWKRDLEYGCVGWMAKESWAVLILSDVTPCKGEIGEGILNVDGKGLKYSSTNDFLVFREYWPWSSEIWGNLMIFDDEGMWNDTLPCPNSLSQGQIDTIQALAVEALDSSLTDGEERMLSRVIERLKLTNGAALSSSQHGCTDGPQIRRYVDRVNPWVSN